MSRHYAISELIEHLQWLKDTYGDKMVIKEFDITGFGDMSYDDVCGYYDEDKDKIII